MTSGKTNCKEETKMVWPSDETDLGKGYSISVYDTFNNIWSKFQATIRIIDHVINVLKWIVSKNGKSASKLYKHFSQIFEHLFNTFTALFIRSASLVTPPINVLHSQCNY